MELGPQPLPDLPPGFAVRGFMALRARLRALLDAATPAELALFERIWGAGTTMMIGTVAKLGVADLLARRGPLSSAEIAEEVGCEADRIHRTLRALVLTGLFARREDGRFDNNRLSAALQTGNPSRMREFAMYFASESNVRAWSALEHTLRSSGCGFEHVHGKSVWDWFEEHAFERETFAQAMMGMTTLAAPAIASLYPFSEIRKVCDVGGGRGTLLSELLVRHPHLRGVLCDSPGVLDSARSLLVARGVEERVELVPGSFFDEVPRGADAYTLKNVLHDWDDAHSIKILSRVRAAMEPGHRLLVCEMLVEKDTDDVMGALADLQMMVVCSGRERGKADFARLFAESGLTLGRVLEGPTIAVIEGIAR